MIVYRKVTGSIPVEGKILFFFPFLPLCFSGFPFFPPFPFSHLPLTIPFLFFFFFFLLWFPLCLGVLLLPSFRVLNTVFVFFPSFWLSYFIPFTFSNLLPKYQTLVPPDFHPALFLRFILRSHLLRTDLVVSRSTVSVRSPGPGPWDHMVISDACVQSAL